MFYELLLMFGEAACGAAEVEYVPVIWSPPASYPPVLRDIASRLPSNTSAKEDDLATYAHEGSHFLSRGKEGYHGLYVGNGLRIFIPTPPVLTAEVFAAIPESERGTIYETYRQQGQNDYWAVQPLMVLDEWCAYLAGSSARVQLGWEKRQESDRHAATMATYAWYLQRLANKAPEYNPADLNAFLVWMDERSRLTIPKWDEMFKKKFK